MVQRLLAGDAPAGAARQTITWKLFFTLYHVDFLKSIDIFKTCAIIYPDKKNFARCICRYSGFRKSDSARRGLGVRCIVPSRIEE